MGLLEELLLLPLAPVRGVVWMGAQVDEIVRRQATDPTMIRGQIAEIEEAREAGELSEEEADELEGPLLRQLVETSMASASGGR
jgi:Gas vesicle protein G